VEEFDAEFALECLNLLRERRLRDAETHGGLSKNAIPRPELTCISGDAVPLSASMAALANQCRIGRPPLLGSVAPPQRFAVANMAYRNNRGSRCCGSARSGLLCLRLLQEKGLQFP